MIAANRADDHRASVDDAVDRMQVNREMQVVACGYARATALGFSLYYLLRATGYLMNLPADIRLLLALPMLASAAYGFIVYWLFRPVRMRPEYAEIALVGVGLLVIFNIFWNLYLTREPIQMLAASYGMVAFGVTAMSVRAWLAQVVPCVICFLVAINFLPDPNGFRIATVLVAGLILSAVCFFSRVSAIRKQIELQIRLGQEAEKLAAANAAKDRFLANMSHELRTPLTGVLGMIDLLRDTRLTPEQADLLSTAKTSSHYLLAIINDILDYSKLEAGKVTFNPTATDVRQLTRDTVGLMKLAAAAKNIVLEVKVPEAAVAPALLDPVRVGQVLLNLVSNAVKFTERGGVTVTLSVMEGTTGPQFCWNVADTGVGLPAARRHALFGRFEQMDSSVTRQQQGTGLGLAIIRELVALMDGTISVESEEGHGSVFTFCIPFVETREAKLDAAVPGLRQALTRDRVAQTLRVLLAEDNPVNQKLIVKILEREDWQVEVAANGEAAVNAVRDAEVPFDVVLMDVRMPVMDGLSATRAIRAMDTWAARVPIIALTANTMPDDCKTYEAVGMNRVVGKPIDMRGLVDTITELTAAAS